MCNEPGFDITTHAKRRSLGRLLDRAAEALSATRYVRVEVIGLSECGRAAMPRIKWTGLCAVIP